jgi:hypothetical protein
LLIGDVIDSTTATASVMQEFIVEIRSGCEDLRYFNSPPLLENYNRLRAVMDYTYEIDWLTPTYGIEGSTLGCEISYAIDSDTYTIANNVIVLDAADTNP